MSQIMTSPTGVNYMVFGDKDRQYQLLEWADEKNILKHHFELRMANSPNDTFSEFYVIVPQPIELTEQGKTSVNVFANFKTAEQIYMIESANESGDVVISPYKNGTVFMQIPETFVIIKQEVTKEEVFATGLTMAQREATQLIERTDCYVRGLEHLQKCLTDAESSIAAGKVDDFTRAVGEIEMPGSEMNV